jgi:hypothetical protein
MNGNDEALNGGGTGLDGMGFHQSWFPVGVGRELESGT